MPKDQNAHFSREVIEMAIKHVKRCSASRVLRGKQNVQEVSLNTDQNGHIKKPTAINSAEGMKRRKPSYPVGRNIKWYTH